MRRELNDKIDNVSNSFHAFEAGKLTQALQDIERLKSKNDSSEDMKDRDQFQTDAMSEKIEGMQKFIWMSTGIIAFIAFMSPVLFRWLWG